MDLVVFDFIFCFVEVGENRIINIDVGGYLVFFVCFFSMGLFFLAVL